MLFIKFVMSFKKYSNAFVICSLFNLKLLYLHQRIGIIKKILKRSLKQIHDRNFDFILQQCHCIQFYYL